MRKSLLIKSLFFSILLLPNVIFSFEDASIARVEHRPIQHHNYPTGQMKHSNVEPHPAARQDLNYASEKNALNNAGSYSGIPQAVPVYPTNLPTSGTNAGASTTSGNSVNVIIPQNAFPTPQN